MWMRLRRVLRAWLLRLAAWLDEAPVVPASSGPPPHWLERVKRAQFVSSADSPAAPPVAPVREVPRVGVPRRVENAGNVERRSLVSSSSDDSAPPHRMETIPTISAPRALHRWPELKSAERRPPLGRFTASSASLQRRSPLETQAPVLSTQRNAVPANDVAASRRHHHQQEHVDTVNIWPDLPDAESIIETFEDAEHLRRIDAEQRGSAWSE